jgi:enediyne biosynthesis protein E4
MKTREHAWFRRVGPEVIFLLCLLALSRIVSRSLAQAVIDTQPDAMFTKITEGPIATDAITVWGLAWGDYDNDGNVDLFAAVDAGWSGGCNALYHNEGNGTFTRVNAGPVAEDMGNFLTAGWADFNNDGWLDLFAVDFGKYYRPWGTPNNLLYQGGNREQFIKIIQDPLVTVPAYGLDQVWGDFDNDGYVDLFINGAWRDQGWTRNYLFRNAGEGGFVEILREPFLSVDANLECAGACDFDNDGDLDLLMTGHPTRLLYRNNGDGTFMAITDSPIVNDTGESLGFAWGDYDNDGWPELCVATYNRPSISDSLHLFHNDGEGQFTRTLLGEASNYQTPTWVDYDNDGHLDLFVTCGWLSSQLRNRLFHNNGDGTFTEVEDEILAQEGGHSATEAWADYDNDGFLDLVVANSYTTGMFLYHNNGNGNHWLMVRLEGTRSNRAAIGAKVRLRATIGGKRFWQMREISGGCSRGQPDLRAHFGLGDATNAEIVRVEWPSGQVTELRNVASKQFLTIVEPNLRVAAVAPGEVQLTVDGRLGSRYEIHSTTGLSNDSGTEWTLYQRVTNTTRSLTVPITNAQDSPQRFYKVVQP